MVGFVFVILLCGVARGISEDSFGGEEANATDFAELELEGNNSSVVVLRSTQETPLNSSSNEINTGSPHGDDELSKWEPPLWILKNYPYYLTGYDEDGRPIWIAEWGKFDMRKLVESGEENVRLFTKYVNKTAKLLQSYALKSNSTTHDANFILDFDGLKIEQFLSIPTVQYAIGLGLQHRDLIEAGTIARIVVINANYVTDTFMRMAKTVFGRLFEIVEVYGTNKSAWLPRLLRLFPRDQLPEWYGGLKGHKPLLVYG